MDDEAVQILWALREVNKSLITGLKTAVFVMEKWDELSPDRRKSMIESMKGLVNQSNEAYPREEIKQFN